ncbi:Uncharacterised protein [Legionella pneumophila]|uniref:trypsin-like peptidase domain-containing protein n=1 Tax=Legionella pneumophila TaxID=446 RepID=UPI0005C88C5F|nr:trypsin-like peptidase domain-containing protein [Legionella pneumophila]HAT8828792.1 hypothetical protein [Legionella pneumophila subsp. pneumophila]WAI80188.1 trypsin-like peptidase domain-containing protein [Legionella pneumophila]CZG44269.1 Uncharacterised protein [Legionella pneumophila]CZH71704.1 Uncharacterised protein [Legionella pneumophila]HAT4693876.1 hypothetical protein [Legionella pneumophila]
MPTLTYKPYKMLSDHDRITNHVIKHIIPFAFGYGPDPDNFIFNSGTATLIDLGRGPLALTCEHVATPFRMFREADRDKINAQLFIGGATGIDRKVIDWDETIDLATLELTQNDLNTISCGQNLCGIRFINKIYTGPIKEKDVIVFAGFPSESSWRYKSDSNNRFAFHSCTCFAEVVSVNNDYIICQSNYINYMEKDKHKITLTDDPTGMSGGAAFLIGHNNIDFSCHFIGIVSTGKFLTQNCLTTYVMLAKRLNNDGTIKKTNKI